MRTALTFPVLRCGLYVGIIAVIFSNFSTSHADIITLKDGASFRAEVLGETRSPETGARFLRIKVNHALSWLNWEAVERVDRSVSGPPEVNVETLLDRLIESGTVVPALKEQLEFEAPPAPVEDEEIPLRAKTIRGWVYLYENERAVTNKKRIPLKEGDPIPQDYILILSPNTRVTLELPGLGEIGLEGGTQIRFEEAKMSRTRSYNITSRLIFGKVWFGIGSDQPLWERVNLKVNSIRSVIQKALIYVETKEKPGEIDIVFLEGEKDLKFWRERDIELPYTLSSGQTLNVSPASNRLDIVQSDNAQEQLTRIKSWNDWQPEALAVDMEMVVPPLKTFPSYLAIPALHPYRLTVDKSITLPAETRSLGAFLKVYRNALEQYKFDTGRYPAPERGLDALSQSFDVGSWHGPYITLELPRKDPWGNDFVYDLFTDNGRMVAGVRSNGPNGKDDKGLEDDIR